MAKASEYRELKMNELEDRLDDVRQDLFTARFNHATGQLDNSSRLGQLRKEVARIETELRRRELENIEGVK